MTFRDSEKERYQTLKSQPQLFSSAAQRDGLYNKKSRFFCLADECADENLYEAIREPAIKYFEDRDIRWHDGLNKRRIPSNHLCCSQCCCVNFLYPMTTNPTLLARVFRQFYPDLKRPLQIHEDKRLPNGTYPYMTFEWIGTKDYLGELFRKLGVRTRGANFTSADFAFRFRRKDDKIQLVLGEWKYTEYYNSRDLGAPSRPKDKKPLARKHNYWPAFRRKNGIFANHGEELYNDLFFEPFYQLMRLQLLAQEMELGREMNADVVSVFHISPEANREFRERVTSPRLEEMFPNRGVLEIWKELVPEDKFMSISVEELLNTIAKRVRAHEREWADYLNIRYGW